MSVILFFTIRPGGRVKGGGSPFGKVPAKTRKTTHIGDKFPFADLFIPCLSIIRLVSSGAANKIEIAAADNYLSSRDYQKLSL
jgi:hypothetical protein